MVTVSDLNAQIKDNELFISTHNHSGAAGAGSSSLAATVLSAQNYFQLSDQSGSPAVAGRLQRNGTNIEYYNGSQVVRLNADGSASTPSARTLGTGATQAAAGNHTH